MVMKSQSISRPVDVDKERIHLDYSESSFASRFGINSPKCYTDAYSVFGLKCVIAPDVPTMRVHWGVLK
ncbi:MAG: hypothetical protein CM1200mP18_08480 [Gammaproteobacteria bacterium]|nr:MAG: hypothetical protein CM1200mP18_08480 [Gammaproteobacteria bacterium]